LKKRIKRLDKRHSDGKSLDDAFAEDQILKNNLDHIETSFPEKVQNTLKLLNENLADVSMDAPKPEVIYTFCVFALFEKSGATVSLTSGKIRDFIEKDAEVTPTPIEAFILHFILHVDKPVRRHVDRIKKIIQRFQ